MKSENSSYNNTKPNSTGSGIYLSGMIKGFEKIGHKQAVIAGIDVNDDVNCFPSEVSFIQ